MNSSISSTASVAGAALPGPWARIRQCLPELARHGLIVSGFCLLIGALLWLAKSGQRFDVQLVYSFATGITSWLVIDGGRFFVDRHSPFGFPKGWRAVALIVAGVCIGFVVGMRRGGFQFGCRYLWRCDVVPSACACIQTQIMLILQKRNFEVINLEYSCWPAPSVSAQDSFVIWVARLQQRWMPIAQQSLLIHCLICEPSICRRIPEAH